MRPPSLLLPAAVHGLSAERTGNAVDLKWTAPTRTTDDILLAGKHGLKNLTAEICRDETAPQTTTACTPIGHLPATSGEQAEFHDALPPQLTQGAPRPLFYRVRVLNDNGKGAAYTRIVAPAGEAPSPVQHLDASPVAGGVAVRWQADTQSTESQVMLRVERGTPQPGPAPDKKTQHAPKGELLAVETSKGDQGGAIDAGARPGVEQRYMVYRSRSVTIGGHPMTMNGNSASVIVSATAQAPPPFPPTGLEAVANTLGAPEIDLVWQASTEPAVAGYVLYRGEGDGPAIKLTPEPVRAFSFVDKAVRAGGRYRYSVAAVNALGVAGNRSSEIIETVPAQ